MPHRQVQLGIPSTSEVVHTGKRPSPFVKWAGGKGQLLDQMAAHFPRQFRTYIEPFLGGGAVFFYLLPRRARLADLSEDLINTYRVVRDRPQELAEALDEHAPHGNDERYFKQVRSTPPEGLSDVQRAARLIFLNKTCFNGLYRVNSKGQFNTPFGHYRKPPRLYEATNLHAASHALKGKVLDVADYHQSCAHASEGDFVYLDPPYHPLTKTANFTGYTKDAFSEKDQEELALVFDRLHEKGCYAMLSNSSHDNVRRLYEGRGYTIIPVSAKRAINSKGDARGEIQEFLVTNYARAR